MPIVAVRTMGLGLESLVGFESHSGCQLIVSPEYLGMLVSISNERFAENTKRIERFRSAFLRATAAPEPRKNPDGSEWEDPQVRRERMRIEGLKRREAMKESKETQLSQQSPEDSIESSFGSGMFGEP
jgi:tRNA wybutosine-synthesizing protein 3